MSDTGATSPGDVTLAAFLDELEAPAPSAAGGTAAAVAAAMAASLVAMVARGSAASWPEAGGVAAQAASLRERLLDLGRRDVEAFGAVLAVLRRPAGERGRDADLGAALVAAAEAPLAIAEAAADVAELAALAAAEGRPPMRPDASAAAALAEAATRSAAHLVDINLATVRGDDRSDRAAALTRAAEDARRRALAAR